MSATISRSDRVCALVSSNGKRGLQLRRQVATILERASVARHAGERIRAAVQHLQREQLLEREPGPPGHRLGDRRRAVHHAQRVGQHGDTPPWRSARAGRYSRTCGSSASRCASIERADLLERQPFGRGVDREHAPVRRPLVLAAEIHELARLQLAAVEEAHRAAQEQHVALLDRAVEERLPGPRHLDHPARVLHDRLEDAQPLPRRNDALRDDAPDDGRVDASLELRDPRDRARVLVAVRHVVQQVARGVHAEPRERDGARRSDALEVRDRRVERDARRGGLTARRRHA